MHLAERRRNARDVADAESDGDGIKMAIREGQRLGIGLGELDLAREEFLVRPLAPDLEQTVLRG